MKAALPPPGKDSRNCKGFAAPQEIAEASEGSKVTTRKEFTTSALPHTRTLMLQRPVDPTHSSHIQHQVKPDLREPDESENFTLPHTTAVPTTHSVSILFLFPTYTYLISTLAYMSHDGSECACILLS